MSSPSRGALGGKGEDGMSALELMSWLHGHLVKDGGGQMAEIEEAARTSLSTLAKFNIQADRRAEWQAKEARARTETYQSQEELLARCKLGVADMPPDVSAALDALSQCAIQLGCPDASTATLLSAMSEMEDEIEALEQELLLNKAAVKDTRRRREQCEGRLAELTARERRLAEEFEEGKDDKIARARKVEYMTAKARQYESALRTLKQELRDAGASDSIYHSTLVGESGKVQAIHSEIRQLHARVAHYDGLPPDMRLAKERVHEVLQELDDVDKQLQQRINDMVVGA